MISNQNYLTPEQNEKIIRRRRGMIFQNSDDPFFPLLFRAIHPSAKSVLGRVIRVFVENERV
ncbi:hypothetical protein BIY37_07260 [Candidatus Brocadia sapporoensis]|uniref:Uncharacterized protein n=1 Tax=Candidatus Brocadia sapporoensis TaxID=392547 RepID=A0A1V6LZT4_9BACT|nr:hypothetical protein BIY37_07260 [Candidatus Brocadia sapporoensis]TVL95862.1 MAG: hypothetical protein CV082_09120 [Candidatus Brocadia sp. BL1]